MKIRLMHIFFLLSPLFIFSCNKNAHKKNKENIQETNISYEIYQVFVEDRVGEFSCRISSQALQVPLEDFCDFINLKYEVCGRCGNVSIFTKNSDVPLVEWNSPYVDFANKEGRIELSMHSIYENGKTYVHPDFFVLLNIFTYTIVEDKIFINLL